MIKTNILINGFGRIGRAILRRLSNKNFVSTIYVNDLTEDKFTYGKDFCVILIAVVGFGIKLSKALLPNP